MAEKKKAEIKKEVIDIEDYSIIKYPLSTEKSLRLMESENKLIFVVSKKANKAEIKKAVEKVFKAKVLKINTLITQDGEKRAYIKFSMETPAIDIATNMGLM
jgi:ribosomal protein uL23